MIGEEQKSQIHRFFSLFMNIDAERDDKPSRDRSLSTCRRSTRRCEREPGRRRELGDQDSTFIEPGAAVESARVGRRQHRARNRQRFDWPRLFRDRRPANRTSFRRGPNRIRIRKNARPKKLGGGFERTPGPREIEGDDASINRSARIDRPDAGLEDRFAPMKRAGRYRTMSRSRVMTGFEPDEIVLRIAPRSTSEARLAPNEAAARVGIERLALHPEERRGRFAIDGPRSGSVAPFIEECCRSWIVESTLINLLHAPRLADGFEEKRAMTTSNGAGASQPIVAFDTALSDVDGEKGRLVLAGFDVEDLAKRATFEDVCALLWGRAAPGSLPDGASRERVRAAVGRGRVEAFARLGALGDALSAKDGMDALRASVAHLVESREEAAEKLVGAVSVFAAAWHRSALGLAPIAPDAGSAHAEDSLRMITGALPSPALARAFGAYLVTVADHGMNASTFAARVVASTNSDLVSAVVAAIGALKGPLHGGAPGPVLDMLDAIGEPKNAPAWIEAELDAGRRIMGMGHRIYRVRDPRALVLEHAGKELRDEGVGSRRLDLARAAENAAEIALAKRHPGRPLKANVEFYTAILLEAVGLPRTMFTPAFAMSRVGGWCAHVAEQKQNGRLIRPSSRYVGPAPATS
jgi:citrate synthase